MRRLALGLLIIGIAACTEQTPVPDPRGDEPAVSLVHVRDLVRGMVDAAESGAARGGTYFVGSDRPYHYLGSGAFFVRLGDSFATAMHKIMSRQN